MDLVERLRTAAKASAFFSTLLPQSNSNAMASLLNEAADAIEEQSAVITTLKEIPAADVVERKTATWLFPHLEPDDITGHVYAECSNCHKVRIVDDFCPACGSRMVE